MIVMIFSNKQMRVRPLIRILLIYMLLSCLVSNRTFLRGITLSVCRDQLWCANRKRLPNSALDNIK